MRGAIAWAAGAAGLCVGAACVAGGGLHQGDIGLFVEGGAVRTGTVINQSIVPNRVFDADLVAAFGEVFTEDPGFICRPGTFAPFTVVGIDMVDALREWQNGSFETYSTALIEVEWGASVTQSPATPNTVVLGPRMAVSPFGELHNHPFHYLVGGAPSGLYLLAFRATNSSVGGASEPFYLVYNRGRPQTEQDQAIAWVLNNLIATPCPADLTGDGLVNSGDLAALLGAWGVESGPADLSGDGLVNSTDLAAMLGAWGSCP